MDNILVFPANMPKALAYAKQAEANGFVVIGASSIPADPSQHELKNWEHLPYVNEPAFTEEFEKVIVKNKVSKIYTEHMAIWSFFNKYITERRPDLQLINNYPLNDIIADHQKSIKFVEALDRFPFRLEVGAPSNLATPVMLQLAAFFRHAKSLFGECEDNKLIALTEVVRTSESGDVVEIGTWCGKSAFAFSWLSHYYKIGNLLCVDPWNQDSSLDQGDKTGILTASTKMNDFSGAFNIFIMNMLLAAFSNVNYIRDTSIGAAAIYQPTQFTIRSEEFGSIPYTGSVSILHIDGNHSYESVKEDYLAWKKFLSPNAWIIFDDYVWPFGDGPKRIGDDALLEYEDRIECAFTMGGALFIRLNGMSNGKTAIGYDT